jgi:nitroimidazol reductase NimA-like FMN-containing flavoprotein (pyridoxamine 5'-phosphate oxidase superfamily)
MADEKHGAYTVDEVNRVKRRQERGAYDYETVHALLDAGALCHVSYVIDGMPYCTPTLYWREASRLYWHGSNSVMMVDRFFPGRSAQLRPTTAAEINATTVIAMDIERASAKIRGNGVADDEEDYALPVYAERLPVRLLIGTPEACPRLLAGVVRPQNLAGYRALRPLEEAVTEAHAQSLPGQFAPTVGNP